ncbi:hypothetical protein EK21DRAFT_93969 [Setomelanomma holmii]|uniref:Uncharacterized protein n=1 Tax=Setomelanomma holmii TaxID=210430 RepID=A0A9P4GZM2_9PLEO|nr:hypothetical protein EK21DRAFT_93969 [Setomelanomma holmii]
MNSTRETNRPCASRTLHDTSPIQQKRKNRRQNAPTASTLTTFDFEHASDQGSHMTNTMAAYGLTEDGKVDYSQDRQARTERYYGSQVFVPGGSVSPCINATDRARRARRNHVREPHLARAPIPTASTASAGVFCDIPPLLHDSTKSQSTRDHVEAKFVNKSATGVQKVADDEVVYEDEETATSPDTHANIAMLYRGICFAYPWSFLR